MSLINLTPPGGAHHVTGQNKSETTDKNFYDSIVYSRSSAIENAIQPDAEKLRLTRKAKKEAALKEEKTQEEQTAQWVDAKAIDTLKKVVQSASLVPDSTGQALLLNQALEESNALLRACVSQGSVNGASPEVAKFIVDLGKVNTQILNSIAKQSGASGILSSPFQVQESF